MSKIELKELDPIQAAEKYRHLKILISAVQRMPKHINECKFSAPPVIPKEFRTSKIPSNLFFSPYQFTMMDMVEELTELLQLYEPFVPLDLKKEIDKRD